MSRPFQSKVLLKSAVAVVTAIGLWAGGVAPAQASIPTLPADQSLFFIDSFRGNYLWSVDPVTGVSTPIGPSHPSHYMNFGAQQNPVDGKVYFLWTSGIQTLSTVNTETGEFIDIGLVHGDATSVESLMITNSGDAFAYSAGNETLYSLDLDSGQTTLVGGPGLSLSAYGYNPVDDAIYAFDKDGGAHTINRANGTATAAPSHDLEVVADYFCQGQGMPRRDLEIQAVAFDGNGNPWFTNGNCPGGFFVGHFASGDVWSGGYFRDATETIAASPNFDLYSMGNIFITSGSSVTGGGTEPLATTGASDSPVFGVVALGGLVLAAGVVLRRRRRA